MEMEYHDEEYVVTRPIQAALLAGFGGALLVFVIEQMLQIANVIAAPTAVVFTNLWLGVEGVWGSALGLLLVTLTGAAAAVLYVFRVERISPLTGAAFALLPWLIVMVLLVPNIGHSTVAATPPVSVLISLVMAVLWGAFIGAVIPALPFSRQVWLNDQS